MSGITGARVLAAYAKCNTWGTAASVTKQILLSSTEGLDDGVVGLINDDAFNQNFRGEGEAGDRVPIAQDLTMQARFEDMDVWFAAAIGSPVAAVVVSSAAANSLVCCRHVITMSPELNHYLTLAVDLQQYVLEIPSIRVRGFSLRVGENGRMMVTFPIVGAWSNYTSSININSTVRAATVAGLGNRLMRKNMTFRMNIQSAGSLTTATDSQGPSCLREVEFTYQRPMAQDDYAVGTDYIKSPDDNDYPEVGLTLTYARMNTVSSNSLAVGLAAGRVWKADMEFTGPYVNSTTARDFLLQMPALQLRTFRAPVVGHNQVRPVATFQVMQATAAPTGMAAITDPIKVTIVNANSVTLL